MGLKNIITALLSLTIALGVAFSATPAQAGATVDGYPDPVIPLMEPLPFPWDFIEGIWQGRVNGQAVWFSFEVRNDAGGRKFLHVIQLDPSTNAIAYEGNGFMDPRTNTVRAGMVGEQSNYLLFIGFYKNDKLSRYPRQVTMLTGRSFQSLAQEFSIMIEKMVPYPVKAPVQY